MRPKFVSPHLLAHAAKPLPKGELNKLCARAKAGDLRAKDQAFRSMLRFVAQVANKWCSYAEADDLFQQGCLGLEKALKKYEPERGLSFATYAVWWIEAFIKNFILADRSHVKLGTTQAQRSLFFSLPGIIAQMERNGVEPSSEEIAAYIGVKASDIDAVRTRIRGDARLDAPLKEDAGTTFLDGEVDPLDLNPEEAYIAMEEQRTKQKAISKALRSLDPRVQSIIETHTLGHEATLAEMGDEFGCSRERIRQLEQRGVKRLRKKLSRLN